MNDCEYFQSQCSAYLDGELTATEQAALDTHMMLCPECSEYLDTLRQMQHLLLVDKADILPSLHQDIMDAVLTRAAHKVAPPSPRQHFMPIFTILAAAVVVVLLVMTGTIGDLMGTGRTDNVTDVANTASVSTDTPKQTPADIQNKSVSGTSRIDKKELPAKATISAARRTLKAKPVPVTAQTAPLLQDTEVSVPKLPGMPVALQNEAFAFCYVATGKTPLPEFDGVLAAESADKTARYYRVKGTSLEKVLTALTEAGYETVSYEDASNVVIDPKADSGLLIILRG